MGDNINDFAAIFIIMIRFVYTIILLALFAACETKKQPASKIRPGAWQMTDYLPLLSGKRVALVVNQTSRIGNTHLVDTLLARGIEVVALFAPEHGIRGQADAGEKIADSTDPQTGIPIISLYGRHRQPTPDDLDKIDIVVFDIQDVGVRFYTYISTLHLVMEACARNGKPLLVLDRPNPNGHYVAGPVLDTAYASFVGMHPIPVVYGLTIGELATMINGEGWLNSPACDLQVIKIANYTHDSSYVLPVKPSPNLPNARAVELYPSLCFFEPTVVSIGRGTTFPFQVIGYPDSTMGTFSFTPRSMPGMSKYPKHQDVTCYGQDLRQGPPTPFTLTYLVDWYQRLALDTAFFTSNNFFDKLAGSNRLRHQLQQGLSAEEIAASWQTELQAYQAKRKKYLLYPDFE